MSEDDLADVFAGLGPVTTRRMFGGRAVYFEGLVFALLLRGDLYLKASADTVPLFRAAGSEPFSFVRAGRTVATSYWRAPADLLEDQAGMVAWARRALAASSAARAPLTDPHP